MIDPRGALELLENLEPSQSFGKVNKVVGLIVEGCGIKAPLGAVCQLIPEEGAEQIPAEVVGFRDGNILFMPYGEMRGIKPGSLIRNSSLPPTFPVGNDMLGKAFDAFGNELGSESPLLSAEAYKPLYATPPNPLSRARIVEPLDVGVRSINSLITLGKGQRVGIMAGSGVGKSTLMGMMARYTEADINVIALIGERGREVLEFMEKDLGPEGMKRSVLLVATSDQSPLVRMRAAYAATAVAEFYRDQGKNVLLMMDSVTRFAMAAREVGLATGEPPTTKGYTPTVFTQLPKLLERAGNSDKGSITGIYTVLVDGDDFNEPIADAVRSILDGHIVLTRDLADNGHYPAIDVLRSVSRLRGDICSREIIEEGQSVTKLLAAYKKVEDMVNIGAYSHGSNPVVDKAISMVPKVNEFLQQRVEDPCSIEEAFSQLHALVQQ
ncbi:FliI/YscN family ATPase [Halodesulfovibrio marinisediminis]|uniref:Type III secretion system ATPase, FliI/YscN n=1 Tax=Halodesulfovibrio marinisediminis DSM 17456 TaxID=1121457 RepID=A0A1N6J5Z1_9BACT|nr:FliI/YscN family ATPase [Halodesulfovibrio marinisediminis]SIO39744.1 type III secretion system ATPase, FliI/YscN [Halodesulfovibrio marinisediminis DSM 17456]